MPLQAVISEIANVDTSLLFKVDLGRHPHAGGTELQVAIFLGSLPHTLPCQLLLLYMQLETAVTQVIIPLLGVPSKP